MQSDPTEEVEDADAGEEVEEEVPNLEVKPHLQNLPSIQIYPLESGQGATCTESSDAVHISVQNQEPVLGEMSSPPSHQNNDGLTSSATQNRL